MELIKDIKRVETEGEQIIAQARRQSDELLSAAREETKKLLESVRDECRQAETQLLKQYEDNARTHAEKLGEESQTQIKALKASAEKNMESAVQLILDAISGKT